jgi:hypothetical protein
MLAPQVHLLCPERRGASRYLSSGYMLGPCESAKEEEEEVQEGQGDLSSPLNPPPLLWWLLWPLVWYTLLSIVCILTTLTVSLLGVTRSSTI